MMLINGLAMPIVVWCCCLEDTEKLDVKVVAQSQVSKNPAIGKW
jgi:hypothetical protein